MNMHFKSELSFSLLTEWGYRLVPIVPPGVELSKSSQLYYNPRDPRGKAPGRQYSDGKWGGIRDWQTRAFSAEEYAAYENQGAGTGVHCVNRVVGIDADIFIEEYAAIVRDEIEKRFGLLPMRIGRAPKAIYVLRTAESMSYANMTFGPKTEDSTHPGNLIQENHIEFLTNSSHQFVAIGIHPQTLAPYKWVRSLVPLDDLPCFSLAEVETFVKWLKANLPDADDASIRAAATGSTSPDSLRGDLELVREAVRMTPNKGESFKDRKAITTYGQALKGALANHPVEAREMFVEFCERWEDGQTTDGWAESNWDRFQTSLLLGVKRIFRMAHDATNGAFDYVDACSLNSARINYEKPSDDVGPGLGVGGAGAAKAVNKGFLTYFEIYEAFNSSTEEFLIAGLMPKVGIGVMFGDSQGYKSFVAISQCLALANGVDWAGRAVMPGAAFYIAAEGGSGVLKRIVGAQQAAGFADRDAPIFLRTVTPNLGAKSSKDAALIVAEIDVHSVPPSIVTLDTAAASMGGEDENTQGMATLLLNAKRISDHYGCFVLIVHHCGLAAKDRGRGWSGQDGNADYAVSIMRQSDLHTRFDLKKLKDGPADLVLDIQLKSVPAMKTLANGEIDASTTTLIVERIVEAVKEPETESTRIEPDPEAEDEAQGDIEVTMLRLVAERPGLPLRDYGARMGLSHAGVRKILDRLARQKLAQLRTQRWSVTPSGAKHLKTLDAGNKDLFS